MENASLLSQMADNWMLLAMFTLFIGAILWAIRPGSRAVHQETAIIPFRNEDHPGSSEIEELQS
ncbi:cbb3-type cytochrome c oxidase subunit 3 [Cognatiyoonia sp. IB215446]|uniref:cbb3-type cytochrome oxidase subunit 3 n=1 Tax=Cognatiyoonia sp. IB215446 TaxID=3097355 RepID=UPI002A0FABF3|nr:cbb3-type cytochrome c oxidase subunit 3 [Cognatiyoonia sp. IB215446]MDX8347213.1 cbb3-type cytochrome c oxidase subunit 3 [Cognatiyoonia sp. IB215446]